MTSMDCKTCLERMPDLLLESQGSAPSGPDAVLAAHMAACPACATEWNELRATFSMLDEWTAPEPSAYFDSRLHARLREAQAAPPESLWERLAAYLQFSTGRELRPALAGAFLFLLLLGGGTVAGVLSHPSPGQGAGASPVVNDLRIYDNNAQALEQMDLLDEAGNEGSAAAPQS